MQMLLHLLFLSLASFCSSNNEPLGKVIFANVLYRHGDRTPINPCPKDPYRNESKWPVPLGQLTNIGKHQHLILGHWLRKRYAHLLPQSYSLYDIYVMSTDVDRTLMSAEANLAGLYPPIGDQIWDIKKWIPIPVHTTPELQDSLLAGKKYCDKYNYELQKVLNSADFKKIDKENAELYRFLSEKCGKRISSLEDLNYIYNDLYIETLYNKTLPSWTKSVYPEKLKPFAEQSFKIQAYNKILQRLKSGPLLKNMIEHMLEKSEGALTPDRKLWIYSAHDETVANLMMTLDVFEPHCPPYTATLLVELRLNAKDEYVVTVFYKNSTEEPMLLTVPGCTAACPLAQFIAVTKDVVPENWERECLMDFEKFHFSVNATATIAILTSSLLMLVILMMIIVSFVFWHYKREHNQYYLRLSMDAA